MCCEKKKKKKKTKYLRLPTTYRLSITTWKDITFVAKHYYARIKWCSQGRDHDVALTDKDDEYKFAMRKHALDAARRWFRKRAKPGDRLMLDVGTWGHKKYRTLEENTAEWRKRNT